jgi:hypothetical protein
MSVDRMPAQDKYIGMGGKKEISDEAIQTLKKLLSHKSFINMSIGLENIILRKNNLLRQHTIDSSLLLNNAVTERNKIADLYLLTRNFIWWSSLVFYLSNNRKEFDLERCTQFIQTYSGTYLSQDQLSSSLILIVAPYNFRAIDLIQTTTITLQDAIMTGYCSDCCTNSRCREKNFPSSTPHTCYDKCMEIMK